MNEAKEKAVEPEPTLSERLGIGDPGTYYKTTDRRRLFKRTYYKPRFLEKKVHDKILPFARLGNVLYLVRKQGWLRIEEGMSVGV